MKINLFLFEYAYAFYNFPASRYFLKFNCKDQRRSFTIK